MGGNIYRAWVRFILALALASAVPALSAAESAAKSKARAASSQSAAKVDLNTADAAALEALPGVGPATAKAIVAARPFSSVEDLERVPGIGPAKLADLRGHVKVTRRSTAKVADAAAASPQKKVDVNTADETTLETLPEVGPTVAQSIIETRPFASVDELARVPGIGPTRLEILRDRVTVGRGVARAEKSPRASRSPDADERALEPTGRVTSRSGNAGPAAPASLVNLNTATRDELEALPEIGPVKAQAIIEARPFKSKADVMRVKGIKEATFDAIRDRITVR